MKMGNQLKSVNDKLSGGEIIGTWLLLAPTKNF